MGGRAVTIEDVARESGVSRQTVSRVLNRHPSVREEVRRRVQAAIDHLGYVPNLAARRMGGSRSFLITAINDRQRTIDNWQAGRGNDWVDQMLFGGMTECERHQYNFIFQLIDTDRDRAREQLLGRIGSIRPDGVILTPPHCDNDVLVELLSSRGIACARIGHRDGVSTIDVHMDEAGAAATVTDHLLGLGHRRIAFISGAPNYGNSALRIEGYRAALTAAGVNGVIVRSGEFRFDVASREIRELLTAADRPTAIIADNDEMAFAALHVATELGLSVPGDASVVSFEDTPGVRFSVPPLTAVRQPTSQMIATACRTLIATVDGNPGIGVFELPFEFKVRASTASPGGR